MASSGETESTATSGAAPAELLGGGAIDAAVPSTSAAAAYHRDGRGGERGGDGDASTVLFETGLKPGQTFEIKPFNPLTNRYRNRGAGGEEVVAPSKAATEQQGASKDRSSDKRDEDEKKWREEDEKKKEGAKNKTRGSLDKWRKWIRIVAMIDMFIHAGFIGFCTAFLSSVSVQFVSMDEICPCAYPCFAEHLTRAHAKTLYLSLGVILLFGVIGRVIQLYSSCNLFQAAVMAQDETSALKLTWPWRASSIAGQFICPLVSTILGAVISYVQMALHFTVFIYACVAILAYEFIWRLVAFSLVTRFSHKFAISKVDDKPRAHRPRRPSEDTV